MDFLDSLGDGWTIYLWLVVGGMIIAVSIYGIRWASQNQQFDESDKDKMSPADYAKSREVLAAQEETRRQVLQRQAEERHRPA